MGNGTIDITEIEGEELTDLLSDDEEMYRIIDQDEVIVYDEIVWDQQNVRLKKEGITLINEEKKIIIMLNGGISVSKIAEIERKSEHAIRADFYKLCKKLCVKNQKEAYHRAKDLNLL